VTPEDVVERIKHGDHVIPTRSQPPARYTGIPDGSPVY
jgi:hypothetical protein